MPIDPYRDLRQRLQRRMEAHLTLTGADTSVERTLRQMESALDLPTGSLDDADALMDVLQDAYTEALLEERVRLSVYESSRLFSLIVGDLVGFGPLDAVLDDPTVSAAYVSGAGEIMMERGGRLEPSGAGFDDTAHLQRIAQRMFTPMGSLVGDWSGPISGHLPDGSRVDAILDPAVSPDGIQIAVRVRPDPEPLDGLVDADVVSAPIADFLQAAIHARRGLLVAGPYALGKMILSALAGALPDETRLLAIERAAELALDHANVIRLEARPQESPAYAGEALLRRASDFQPDWVFLSEVTPAISSTYIAMLARLNLCAALPLRATPTPTARQALDRLVLLALRAHPDRDDEDIRAQLLGGLDVIVLAGFDSGGAPRVLEVAHVARDVIGTRLETLFTAHEGSTERIVEATAELSDEAAIFNTPRSAPAQQPRALTPSLFLPNGSLYDQLDELFLFPDGRAVGLREEEGLQVTAHVPDVDTVVEQLASSGTDYGDARVSAGEHPNGARVALAFPPVAVGGPAALVERFAARPGGLKRLADLGLISRDSGTLLVESARAGRGILFCGPTGTGKLALIQGLLSVLQDADQWQVLPDADTVALAAGGGGKMLAAVHCADGADPFFAITSDGDDAVSTSTLAGSFDLLVRMGRVGHRQRMVFAIDQIVVEGHEHRYATLFAVRPNDDGTALHSIQFGEAAF